MNKEEAKVAKEKGRGFSNKEEAEEAKVRARRPTIPEIE